MKINFNQTGGFPLETDTLDNMQKSYELFHALGRLAGQYAIVEGCHINGNNVSDGVVYVDGELMPFRGGLLGTEVVIIQEVEQRVFEDGQSRDVYFKKYATFGSGYNSIPWSSFRRLFPLSSAVMIDEIRMYAGDVNNLPPGWYLCDGQNGTVDLRDRFIVGYNPNNPDYDQIGKTGGEAQNHLTVDQLPPHNHVATMGEAGYHRHTYSFHDLASKGKRANDAYWRVEGGTSTGHTSFEGLHTHPITIGNTGNGKPVENRPPYFVLAFIQYKGV